MNEISSKVEAYKKRVKELKELMAKVQSQKEAIINDLRILCERRCYEFEEREIEINRMCEMRVFCPKIIVPAGYMVENIDYSADLNNSDITVKWKYTVINKNTCERMEVMARGYAKHFMECSYENEIGIKVKRNSFAKEPLANVVFGEINVSVTFAGEVFEFRTNVEISRSLKRDILQKEKISEKELQAKIAEFNQKRKDENEEKREAIKAVFQKYREPNKSLEKVEELKTESLKRRRYVAKGKKYYIGLSLETSEYLDAIQIFSGRNKIMLEVINKKEKRLITVTNVADGSLVCQREVVLEKRLDEDKKELIENELRLIMNVVKED